MKTVKRSRPLLLRLEELEPREAPCASLGTLESFDTTAVGALPAAWSQWSDSGANAFAVSSAQSDSPPNSLAVGAPTGSGLSARSWVGAAQPANVQVNAAVYLNTLIPAVVFARGAGLATTTPSYYAVAVTQGLDLKLLRVVGGVTTTLGEVKSADWFANKWACVQLFANGNNLRAQVVRDDTGQYLNAFGQWQTGQAWALNLTDTATSSGGEVGLGRLPSYTGTVYFDDFSYGPVNLESQPPTVTINAPAAGAAASGVTQVQASATDDVSVSRVEFYVDNVLRAVDAQAPYAWNFDTTLVPNGTHVLTVKAYDPAQNIGQSSETITTQNDFSPLPRPTIPQHYPNIRIAELAYNSGSPLPAFDSQLLQSSVDLVVPDPVYFSQINSAAPNTPKLIYTNVSSVYGSLLTDWLNFADARGFSREEAFYHVAQATAFSGAGGSTKPVNWFWGVYRGGPTLTDQTWQAHASGVTFPGAGQSLYVGYPDRFREINLNLASGAGGGWSAILEYPTAVDAAGNPTSWAPQTTLTDGTAGLAQSGRITFDPPADWTTASLNGSPRLYYVRFRTLTSGTAPAALTILGRDYVGANGTNSFTIPAFDWAADVDHDGYLNDAEYAKRALGMDARFAYESRLFSYGQMRFATNPGDAAFRGWAADYDVRYLNGNPLAAGLFMDNSNGKATAAAGGVFEPTASYTADYASLLYEIGRAIAPRWILANSAGGGTDANPTIQRVQGYYEEFAVRPLASNYQQFEGLAAAVASRAALASPPPYAVLDSYPQGGSPTDARTQLATLASYYLLADPASTFLDFYGGFSPASPWTQHWSPAAAYNIGQPTTAWSLFATGADPASPSLTYRVYQRSFTNALVLYKPLSYGNGVTGTLADPTATTFAFAGAYYPLQVDGTLGTAITSITLRNGEGAILVPVPALSSLVVAGFPSPTTAGTPGSFTVTAEDSSGQVILGYTGTVHFTSTDGSAALPADYTFTQADNGTHSFSAVFKMAGAQALSAADTASGVTGAETSITVGPAAASQVSVAAPAAVTAGSAFGVTVTALDRYGNRATGYAGTVHLTSTDGAAALPADYTFTSTDNGVHTFTVTLKTAGAQSVTVSDAGNSTLTGTAGGIAVRAAAARALLISAPAQFTAGVPFSVTVTAVDAFGNVATGYTGTVHFSDSAGRATLPANYKFTTGSGGDNGVHTFAGLILRRRVRQTLTVADTLDGSISGGVTETPN
jgi:hypothetical protein